MSKGTILSLGSINADFQVRTPRPLSAGETLIGTDFTRLGGGKAANRAFLAHRLGHQALLLARTGDDELAEQARRPLRRAGLMLDYVTTARNTATAVSMIAVPPDGKKSILLASNANDAWDKAALDNVLKAIAAAPIGSCLTADFEITPEVTVRAIAAARERGFKIVIDPAPPERVDRALLPAVDAISPDMREASALTDSDPGSPEGAAQAAEKLAALGVGLACVKLSNGGCIAIYDGHLRHVPPVSIDVVDSTGAGDAFTGALAVALLEEQQPEQAILFATAASHLAVTKWGSQESYPTREQIMEFIPRLASRRHAVGG